MDILGQSLHAIDLQSSLRAGDPADRHASLRLVAIEQCLDQVASEFRGANTVFHPRHEMYVATLPDEFQRHRVEFLGNPGAMDVREGQDVTVIDGNGADLVAVMREDGGLDNRPVRVGDIHNCIVRPTWRANQSFPHQAGHRTIPWLTRGEEMRETRCPAHSVRAVARAAFVRGLGLVRNERRQRTVRPAVMANSVMPSLDRLLDLRRHSCTAVRFRLQPIPAGLAHQQMFLTGLIFRGGILFHRISAPANHRRRASRIPRYLSLLEMGQCRSARVPRGFTTPQLPRQKGGGYVTPAQ